MPARKNKSIIIPVGFGLHSGDLPRLTGEPAQKDCL